MQPKSNLKKIRSAINKAFRVADQIATLHNKLYYELETIDEFLYQLQDEENIRQEAERLRKAEEKTKPKPIAERRVDKRYHTGTSLRTAKASVPAKTPVKLKSKPRAAVSVDPKRYPDGIIRFSEKTVKELRADAKQLGIMGYSRLRKFELENKINMTKR